MLMQLKAEQRYVGRNRTEAINAMQGGEHEIQQAAEEDQSKERLQMHDEKQKPGLE